MPRLGASVLVRNLMNLLVQLGKIRSQLGALVLMKDLVDLLVQL